MTFEELYTLPLGTQLRLVDGEWDLRGVLQWAGLDPIGVRLAIIHFADNSDIPFVDLYEDDDVMESCLEGLEVQAAPVALLPCEPREYPLIQCYRCGDSSRVIINGLCLECQNSVVFTVPAHVFRGE